MDFRQLVVGALGPQDGVVGGFLLVHVRQAVGDHERQLPVQVERRRRAGVVRRGLDRVGLPPQRAQLLALPLVLGAAAARRAGPARLQHRVDEVVLVPGVAIEQFEQRPQLRQRVAPLGGVVGVHAADRAERLGHEAAQPLVNRCVQIHTCVGHLPFLESVVVSV